MAESAMRQIYAIRHTDAELRGRPYEAKMAANGFAGCAG